jgi:hypothetical protein
MPLSRARAEWARAESAICQQNAVILRIGISRFFRSTKLADFLIAGNTSMFL